MDTELFKEWFQAFSQSAGITLHIENIYGETDDYINAQCLKIIDDGMSVMLCIGESLAEFEPLVC